jgi:hypothetical protein
VRTLNDEGVQVIFSNKQCKMLQGYMVLSKGVHMATLFHLDVCTIECNNSLICAMKRYLGSIPSQSVPFKQSFSFESKLLVENKMQRQKNIGPYR